MLNWLNSAFESKAERYNRKFRNSFQIGKKMSVDYDLINPSNRKLIEQSNLNSYKSIFDDLESYVMTDEDWIEVAGVSHHQSQTHGILVKEGEQVLLFHDEDNPYDEFAVKIKNLGNQMIGYVPRDFSKEYSNDLENMIYMEVFVESVFDTDLLYPSIHLSIKKFGKEE